MKLAKDVVFIKDVIYHEGKLLVIFVDCENGLVPIAVKRDVWFPDGDTEGIQMAIDKYKKSLKLLRSLRD